LANNLDIHSYPRLCALLGKNPSRLSQAMHNAGFQAANLPFSYVAFNTTATEQALSAMRILGIRGFSLTIPHKERAYPLVDEVDSHAKAIAAINTVINDQGVLRAYNSDWCGVTEALREAKCEFSSDLQAAVLGAGGAARAAVYALKTLGVGQIYVVNRDIKRAKNCVQDFEVEALDYKDLENVLESSAQLLINATPLGSKLLEAESKGERMSYPFRLDCLSSSHTVFDMVTAETELLRVAEKRGASTIAGIRMLLHQAIRQFELFTESEANLEVMEKALLAEYEHSVRSQ